MDKQIIISIGREFGSGGHEIAEGLAKHYDIPLFDKEIFEHIEENEAINAEVAQFYDEKPISPIFYPVMVDGMSLPLEQTVANHIFNFIIIHYSYTFFNSIFHFFEKYMVSRF